MNTFAYSKTKEHHRNFDFCSFRRCWLRDGLTEMSYTFKISRSLFDTKIELDKFLNRKSLPVHSVHKISVCVREKYNKVYCNREIFTTSIHQIYSLPTQYQSSTKKTEMKKLIK